MHPALGKGPLLYNPPISFPAYGHAQSDHAEHLTVIELVS